ncbi:MAG: TolA-binding protein [Pirellulaceae bacterium]
MNNSEIMAMRNYIYSLILIPCLALTVVAQPPAEATPDGALDDVSREVTQLEGELNKYKDNTPEAAATMLKLVDLYHTNGRVFGLVRVAQRFSSSQTAHPQHQAVMLKLLDGLEVVSRSEDAAAVCRQFLDRYPEAPQCSDVEIRLVTTLLQIPTDRMAAAKAAQDVWKRHGNTEIGREYAATAIGVYSAIGNGVAVTAAATLADEVFEKLPASPYSRNIGLRAFYEWRRISQYAKSVLTGNKILKKGVLNPAQDAEQLRVLHSEMAHSYASLGQNANSATSYQSARAIRNDAYVHLQMIYRLHAASAKSAELAPLVNQYVQSFPERNDKYAAQSYLAHAYLRETETDKARALFASLLPFDATTNANGQHYIQTTGLEPAQLTATENIMLDAIRKNPQHGAYLRYCLATYQYSAIMKDTEKTRQMYRELATKSPSDDGHSSGAINWLLSNAVDDAQFKAEVVRLVQARSQFIHMPGYRTYIKTWQQSASKAKKDPVLKARADLLATELANSERDPIVALTLKHTYANSAAQSKIRQQLMLPATLAKLSDEHARRLLETEGYFIRHYGIPKTDCTTAYGLLAKRFPKDYTAALLYLTAATDYSPAEVGKEAALHFLSFEPVDNNYDVWRRLLQAGDRAEDTELVKRGYAWTMKATAKYGKSSPSSSGMGDILLKHKMEKEAIDYWTTYVDFDRNYSESRDCATRLIARKEGAERLAYAQEMFKHDTDFHGRYASWLADDYFKAGDIDNFVKVLAETQKRQNERPFRGWDFDPNLAVGWVGAIRANQEATDANRQKVYAAIEKMQLSSGSAAAAMARLETQPADQSTPIAQLLLCAQASKIAVDNHQGWDPLMTFVQAALTRKDYIQAATLATGMLNNIQSVDEGRRKAGRDVVTQCYARVGRVGLTIDEDSPIAPLMKAALYLRLGDENLAFDEYEANKALFDEHRNQLPVDLIGFVTNRLIAAGGDKNHEYIEEMLRGWLVKNSESTQIDAAAKARVQFLLGQNYFKSSRYDLARNEFTTTVNRYPGTPEAIEAQFGIGETFMSQKVFDQAEAVFDKLAHSTETDVIVRAEFLRGVLAFRRGDRDDARDIFRGVLERVPNVKLANQALFNLAEVYGAEQKYIDQLNLLRTVGRLGRRSKRYHRPGMALSIVVHDSDLGISRGHNKIPVIVTTKPGGDVERVFLTSAGAGKGLFRVDVDTRLGQVTVGDNILQLTGLDTIECDYPAEFKAQFKNVPLSDVEIRVAANAQFEASSSKIVEAKSESFSEQLARQAIEDEDEDQRVSQARPINQIKPGNLVYLKVSDPDRDLSNEVDEIVVKLTADSGDQVQVALAETGPHTGLFEGTIGTAELPAGALATDTAIDHSPLMAIDPDLETYWMSAPDGATPKQLTIDMKDLRLVSQVKISSPGGATGAPVRGDLMGSQDGEFWFRIASQPPRPDGTPVAEEYGKMTRRVYNGNHTNFTTWAQVVALATNSAAIDEAATDELTWERDADEENGKKAYSVIWHGKLLQPQSGAARIRVDGGATAMSIDGQLELPLGRGARTIDVWLDRGLHDLTIFAASAGNSQVVSATRARANLTSANVILTPFRAADFDLEDPVAETEGVAKVGEGVEIVALDDVWEFQFPQRELRYTRLVANEYRGEALAINHVEIGNAAENYIPTDQDVLSLSTNEVLEIAAGDVVRATYTDEFTQNELGSTQLLTRELTATYNNASVASIAYDFVRGGSGAVATQRKDLKRIDTGERLTVEITDYDQDQTNEQDTIRFQVIVNDGLPVLLTATETEPYSGIFAKEVDTTATEEEGKLTVKKGDRIYVRYIDTQNTFPGHAVPRETVVYVNEPSDGRVRILESRVTLAAADSKAPPRVSYLPPDAATEISGVAFEAPLTVEVIDPDQAKDSLSKVVVSLVTSDGATIDVECEISTKFGDARPGEPQWALEEGRFIGQVIMQLGSKASPAAVPLTSEMPRNLVGSVKFGENADEASMDNNLVTRVLNLTGQDVIEANYQDELRPAGKPEKLLSRGRLLSNGKMAVTDRDYEKVIDRLHVGERLFLIVTDADQDRTDERDTVAVEITGEFGEREMVSLSETLAHSGVFTGSFLLKATEKATPDNLDPASPEIESYFGDTLGVRYVDVAASTEDGRLEEIRQLPVVIGTDGLVAAFSKTFNDETLAVETKFRVAESYFELFKSHKELDRGDEQKTDLEAGRRVLQEVMKDYPNPKYAPRVAYLLGQFAQELEQWDEAIRSYELILRQFPDHTLAADAQYKLAQAFEEAGEFDKALEEYVTLAATYPQSPLISSVMIRISDYFYKNERFEVAAQVGQKFLEKFETHAHASRMAFRVGQCYYKAEKYKEAGEAFDDFDTKFHDDELSADSVFWAGESYRLGNNNFEAFRRYQNCRYDYPSSEAAKYARGRLALPEMLQQFEQDVNSLDQP